MPELHSRWDLGQATALELNTVTPYGSFFHEADLTSTTGATVKVAFVNPHAMLHKAFYQGGALARLLTRRLLACPSSPEAPWRLVLYSDEVVPGNQLSHDNKRKLWVIYFSFLELGANALSNEDAWFCVFVKRSRDVNLLSAGMGQVFGAVIKLFFGAAGHDISSGGLYFQAPDGSPLRLFANLAMVLQDGGAHKSVWHCKGDAGTKFCMLCRNLYSEKSELTAEDGSKMLTCTLIHESDLDFATDDDIRGSVRRLADSRATDSKQMFEKRSQAVGFNHEPHGMLLDVELDAIVRPASHFCHDWMHAMFVHGAFHTMMYATLEALSEAGVRDIWEKLTGYIGLWTWPARVANSAVNDLFTQKRKIAAKRAKTFKCTASEGLSAYAVVAYFIQKVMLQSQVRTAACQAFVAMAEVVDLLVAVPLGCVTPERLRDAVRVFLQLVEAAGWRKLMHPKFHWLVHLPRQLAHFGCLPTCWVHERKHRMVKRYANEICNTSRFERSVLGELTSHHLAALSKPHLFDYEVGLVSPRPAHLKLAQLVEAELGVQGGNCLTSNEARVSGVATCSRGDVVLLRGATGRDIVAGQVWALVSYHDEPIAIVAVWALANMDKSTGTAEWREEQAPMLIPMSDVITPVTYTRCRAGIVRTLVPCQLRSGVGASA